MASCGLKKWGKVGDLGGKERRRGYNKDMERDLGLKRGIDDECVWRERRERCWSGFGGRSQKN
jgi:hypothetical protein